MPHTCTAPGSWGPEASPAWAVMMEKNGLPPPQWQKVLREEGPAALCL